jgi:hypothetical protein
MRAPEEGMVADVHRGDYYYLPGERHVCRLQALPYRPHHQLSESTESGDAKMDKIVLVLQEIVECPRLQLFLRLRLSAVRKNERRSENLLVLSLDIDITMQLDIKISELANKATW